jgi:hypothetical protein
MTRCREKAEARFSVPWNAFWLFWCGRCEGLPGGLVFGSSKEKKGLEWGEINSYKLLSIMDHSSHYIFARVV